MQNFIWHSNRHGAVFTLFFFFNFFSFHFLHWCTPHSSHAMHYSLHKSHSTSIDVRSQSVCAFFFAVHRFVFEFLISVFFTLSVVAFRFPVWRMYKIMEKHTAQCISVKLATFWNYTIISFLFFWFWIFESNPMIIAVQWMWPFCKWWKLWRLFIAWNVHKLGFLLSV